MQTCCNMEVGFELHGAQCLFMGVCTPVHGWIYSGMGLLSLILFAGNAAFLGDSNSFLILQLSAFMHAIKCCCVLSASELDHYYVTIDI